MAMYEAKFGPRTGALIENVARVFREEEGIEMSMGGLTGNTFASHRLLAYAGTMGAERQNALAERLFRAYFSEERYLGDRGVLLECARDAGIAGAEAVVGDDRQFADEVRVELNQARGMVTGVPFFVVDGGRFKMSGAQPAEVWAEVLEEYLEQQERRG